MFSEYCAQPSKKEIESALVREEILSREPQLEPIVKLYSPVMLRNLAGKRHLNADEMQIVTAAMHIALARRGREFNFRKFYPGLSSS